MFEGQGGGVGARGNSEDGRRGVTDRDLPFGPLSATVGINEGRSRRTCGRSVPRDLCN
jgi:hypothetical protein